ncbi:OmpA family protein [Aureibacter tunicatorum]|uniref:Outer membrane protein OmpA-like peptidoglycan-associated protein n=1 Tax=Aureibacter tunicatorum TaxID=866807 RepID=A0AAE4BT39_9BACT|nr:OmpA family protein [Aureibacter tunicatorum]MDR6239458.1 outer membrane protein OmpA-like peptidoglycan-associated protein [Aureibacter tunicatorum]BDD04619.1 hypothetical protein AUTU_21020 [Aureibacter tunicatorum]
MIPRTLQSLLLICTLLFSSKALAQNAKQLKERAETAFKEEQYFEAATMYEKLIQKDPESASEYLFKCGECHRKSLNYVKARDYFFKAYKKNYKDTPQSLFYYALMQKNLGIFDKALNSFEKYINDSTSFKDTKVKEYKYTLGRAIVEKDGIVLAQKDFKEKAHQEDKIRRLGKPVNSKYNDYAAFAMYNDYKIMLTSSRINSDDAQLGRYGEAMDRNYAFQGTTNGWREISETALSSIGEGDAYGTVSFNKDITEMYFTACFIEFEGCGIFKVSKTENGWSEPAMVNKNINKPGSDNKQPFLTENADTLYFVSNRKGGFGGYDIWKSVIDPNTNDWAEPICLGGHINTTEDEMAPSFISGLLYFSSNGHLTYGGQDIYYTYMDDSIENPQSYHLSYPFNSEGDDMYISLLGNKKGYLSSKRKGGLGNFDIYTFNISDIEPFNIKRETMSIIASHTKILKPSDLTPSKKDKLVKVPPKFMNVYFDTNSTVLNAQSKNLLNEITEFIANNPNIKMTITGHADNTGSKAYNVKLSEKRAKSVAEFLSSNGVSSKNLNIEFFGDEKPDAENEAEESGRELNRRVEFSYKFID